MSNIETVKSIYAAFGRGDVPAILERVAENVEWEHDSVDHGIPYLKPGRGREHVLSFFQIVGRDLSFRRFELANLLEGGEQVAAVLKVEGTYTPTGKSFTDYEMHMWTFDERGQIRAFRHVVDTHAHFLATR